MTNSIGLYKVLTVIYAVRIIYVERRLDKIAATSMQQRSTCEGGMRHAES